MTKTWQRYRDVYAIMFRNSLIREMNFKANFLMWMGVELLWFAGQLIFISVLFGYVTSIHGWTKWEMVLLVGTNQVITQTFQAFFYTNLANLPELVRTGRLDFLILQPLDSQFAVSTKQFGLESIVTALVGVGFILAALVQLHLVPTALQIALFLIALGLGVMIHYAIFLVLATASFWIVRAQGLIYGYYSVSNLGRYPDVIFSNPFRFIFSWIIPVLAVSSVPSRLLVRAADSPLWLMGQLALATLIVTVATRLLWKTALRRYSSASS